MTSYGSWAVARPRVAIHGRGARTRAWRKEMVGGSARALGGGPDEALGTHPGRRPQKGGKHGDGWTGRWWMQVRVRLPPDYLGDVDPLVTKNY